MILCFFIAALATVIESGVINSIDQGMFHNFCYLKAKIFQLWIFYMNKFYRLATEQPAGWK